MEFEVWAFVPNNMAEVKKYSYIGGKFSLDRI